MIEIARAQFTQAWSIYISSAARWHFVDMSSEKWRRFWAEKTITSRQQLQIQEEICIVNLVEWFQAKELEEKRNFEGKLGYVVLNVMILFTNLL